MELLGIIILIVVLGLVWWDISPYIPMPPAVRNMVKIVFVVGFVVVLLVALLNFLGVGTGVLHYRPNL